jgi:hypothetical protein
MLLLGAILGLGLALSRWSPASGGRESLAVAGAAGVMFVVFLAGGWIA